MKYVYFLSFLLIGLLYGCGKKGEVVYPQTNTIAGEYSYSYYDTLSQPIEFFDTIPAANGVITQYSKDSVALSVEDWTGTRIIDWKGKIDPSGYYYSQVDDYDSGAVRHHHYNIYLLGDTMMYNYHARIGEGTRYDVGGQIVRETVIRFKGAINRR